MSVEPYYRTGLSLMDKQGLSSNFPYRKAQYGTENKIKDPRNFNTIPTIAYVFFV